MAHSARTIRITVASILALLMVGGAYFFTGPNPFGNVVEAQSAEELLKEYAAKDSDTDGLPDWQESLYGTDPFNPESFQAGIQDGDAVAQGLVQPKVAVRAEGEPDDLSTLPGTLPAASSLTDRFAQTLLKQFLLNRGTEAPTQAEIANFVQAGIADLVANSKPNTTYGTADVTRASGSGRDALIAYAIRAEQAIVSENIDTEMNELAYFSEAMKGDDSALTKIGQASDAYAATARALIAVPAPDEVRVAHLALVNSFMGMSAVTADMATLKSDPLRALVGIGLYTNAAKQTVNALAAQYGVFSARQARLNSTDQGAVFLGLLQDAAAAQERENTTP